jgi:integrase
MSVYRKKESSFYYYDFEHGGHRFHGSTRRTSRREAEAVEREELERARQRVKEAEGAKTSLQLEHVIARYWQEVGQHHSGKDNTFRDLTRIYDYFGKTKLLTEITDDDVARLVAWRRGHRVVRDPNGKAEDCPLISNATVNRSTTEVVKKLFTRAKTAWGVRFLREPNWKAHFLSEPEERVRELRGDEGERLDAATRDDYAPFFSFMRASGLRLAEGILRWTEVDWDTAQIVKLGKGSKRITVPITPTIRNILWQLRGHHPTFVFTYIAERTRDGHVRGQRYPLTMSGIKTAWRRLRKRSGVEGFRFHDLRHDLATKLLRETGNLKLVQRTLNHADITTTVRYAHVLDNEVAEALERVAKSRRKSRSDSRDVA